MNSITSKTVNKFKTFKLNNKTYYPSFYFNNSNNYKFDFDSKITIKGVSYYTK